MTFLPDATAAGQVFAYDQNRFNNIQEENRMLKLMLGEAMHELGRAVSITQTKIVSHTPGKKFSIHYNPVTCELVVMPDFRP